jgi:hypothetical protein
MPTVYDRTLDSEEFHKIWEKPTVPTELKCLGVE